MVAQSSIERDVWAVVGEVTRALLRTQQTDHIVEAYLELRHGKLLGNCRGLRTGAVESPRRTVSPKTLPCDIDLQVSETPDSFINVLWGDTENKGLIERDWFKPYGMSGGS